MTPELLAARREILLARVALQRARLLRDVAALRTAARRPIASMLSSHAVGALMQASGAGTASAPDPARSWLDWAAVALQVARAVESLRQPR